MTETRSNDPVLLRTILDAIPSFVFVVDGDVRVLDYNRAAAGLLGEDRGSVLRHRAGDVLRCIHSTDSPEGCGHGQACGSCVVRNSVTKAIHGNQVVRNRAKMELATGDAVTPLHVLVTTSGFDHDSQRMVLLVVEDISQIVELHQIIPICMYCKKIRTDDQFWLKVENYFSRNWDMNFSHGICPECYENEVRKMAQANNNNRQQGNTEPANSAARANEPTAGEGI
jgi:hypothetical protein